MSVAQSARPVLIADPDPLFLRSLEEQSGSARLPVKLAARTEALAGHVLDPAQLFSAVVINPRLTESGLVIPLVRMIHQHRPVTPVYLVSEAEAPCRLPAPQLQTLAVRGAFTKPLTCMELRAHVAPLDLGLAEEELLKLVTGLGENIDKTQSEASDDEFFPVRSIDFQARTPCFFDVYIRLSPGHYVKVLQAGDVFAAEQLRKYLLRGIPRFHIRKREYAAFLHSCDEMASLVIESPAVTASIKVRTIAEYGEETALLLRAQGMTEAQIAHAQRYVSKVDRLTNQLNLRSKPVLEGYLREVSCFSHAVSTTMIASLICEALSLTEEVATEVVGLGALLHDIGLYQMPPEIQHEDEDRMSESNRRRYRTHPIVGAQLLQGVQGIETGVIDIVKQHHERRNMKGFPVHFGVSHVNRLAEVVGLADDFSRVLLAQKGNPDARVVTILQAQVLDGFSKNLVEAFREYFLLTLR